MKKSAAVLALIILLPLLSASVASTTKAQDIPTHGDGVTIWSPCNRTYAPNEDIIVNASASTFAGQGVTYSGTYTIDDGPSYTLHTESLQIHSWDLFFGALVGTAKLPNLPEGQHKLTIYMKAGTEYPKGPTMSGEATVYFTIGDINPPNITLNAIDDEVFNQTSVPLNFTINEPTSWIAYSLDNGTQTTIDNNTTLTTTTGNHTIIIYANDTSGNLGQSGIAHFAVQAPALPQTGEIVVLVAIVIVSIVAIAVLLVIWRTRKPLNHPA